MKSIPATDASTLTYLAEASLVDFPGREEGDDEILLERMTPEMREVAEVLMGRKDQTTASQEAWEHAQRWLAWARSRAEELWSHSS